MQLPRHALREDLLHGCGRSADNWGEGGFPSGRRWPLLTWVLGTLCLVGLSLLCNVRGKDGGFGPPEGGNRSGRCGGEVHCSSCFVQLLVASGGKWEPCWEACGTGGCHGFDGIANVLALAQTLCYTKHPTCFRCRREHGTACREPSSAFRTCWGSFRTRCAPRRGRAAHQQHR